MPSVTLPASPAAPVVRLCECGCGLPTDSDRGRRRIQGHYIPVVYITVHSKYAVVPLTRRKYSIIDAEDRHLLGNFKWQASRNTFGKWYARRARPCGDNNSNGYLKLHHVVMQTTELIDHINGDGLNNRKQNLRRCTQSQNVVNVSTGTRSKTGFRGVRKEGNKFRAAIRGDNGKHRHLGMFNTAIDAAKAYDVAAKEKYGDFVRLNFPEEQSCQPQS